MSERKRMSRAKAAANPQREVFRGVTASLWFIDDAGPVPDALYDRWRTGTRVDLPPVQSRAVFDREDVEAAVTRGAINIIGADAAMRANGGTFSNGPRSVLTVDTLNAAMEALRRDAEAPRRRTLMLPPEFYDEASNFRTPRSGDDYTDALSLAWATGALRDAEGNARERERERLRAAQYEREAPWRARILASIPQPRRITAAELRARVTPHGYGWRR